MVITMNNLLSYSGINTKVRAMESNLISKEEYTKIANLDTVADFTSFLADHPGYREIFHNYDDAALHRGDVEKLLSHALYLDFAKIYRFADAEQKRDLDLLFFRYEVTILKSCIRLVYSEDEAYDLNVFDPFFIKHLKINVPALSASSSMEEYIRNLKGTQYYPLFEKLQASGNPLSSFDYEMHLDQYYFRKAWKLKGKLLTGENYHAFTSRLGTEIDLLNIMWIYRSKSIYNLDAADILSYILPITYKLTKEQLTRMATTNSMDEFMDIMKNTAYKEMYPALLNHTMESKYRQLVRKVYQLNKRKYPSSMATANDYLYQKELETARLITALECIRYRLSPQNRLSYILQ